MHFLKRDIFCGSATKIKNRIFTSSIEGHKAIGASQGIVLRNACVKTAGCAGIARKVQVAVDDFSGLAVLLRLAVLPTKNGLEVVTGLKDKTRPKNIVLSGTRIARNIVL